MTETYIKQCSHCGGTGDSYRPALYGDGWGGPCQFCRGCGTVPVIEGIEYVRAGAQGNVYRDKRGRFAHIPEEAYPPQG